MFYLGSVAKADANIKAGNGALARRIPPSAARGGRNAMTA